MGGAAENDELRMNTLVGKNSLHLNSSRNSTRAGIRRDCVHCREEMIWQRRRWDGVNTSRSATSKSGWNRGFINRGTNYGQVERDSVEIRMRFRRPETTFDGQSYVVNIQRNLYDF
jgi:hypothetical protein